MNPSPTKSTIKRNLKVDKINITSKNMVLEGNCIVGPSAIDTYQYRVVALWESICSCYAKWALTRIKSEGQSKLAGAYGAQTQYESICDVFL